MVIPMVRENEFSDPAIPVSDLSTSPIVSALLGDRKNAIPIPLMTIGMMIQTSQLEQITNLGSS